MSAWQWFGTIAGAITVGQLAYMVGLADDSVPPPWYSQWVHGLGYLLVMGVLLGVFFGIPIGLLAIALGEWVPF